MATAELPEDLITEILSRLPVKSVKRFRCLSKPLCSIIDSPEFIDSHLSKSSQNPNFRKLIFRDAYRKEFNVYDVNLNQEQDVIRLENPVSSPLEAAVYDYGYCKGLLLLHRGGLRYYVWNPSTRQSRNLHDIPLEPPSENVGYFLNGWGLGYDDSIDDYKAFCMLYVRRNVHPLFEAQFWIYGFKPNIWRRSYNWDFPLLSWNYFLPEFGYFADGIVHWHCTSNSFKREIVAFDVRKETFSILPQPVRSLKPGLDICESTTLHVLEGCLCISYVSSSMSLQAELYIRKKDGAGQFTWIQLYSATEPLFLDKIWFSARLRVMRCLKRGDMIMLDLGNGSDENGNDYLVSYDPKEKSFRKVEIDKDPNWEYPIVCVESLVPLAGGA